MKELVTQVQVQRILQIIALVTPGAGIVIGAVIGHARKKILAGIIVGILWGLWGTAVFGLWRMHLLIGKHYGYTSAAALVTEVAIFVGLGVVAGAFIQKAIGAPGERERKKSRIKLNQEEKLHVS